jgi:hypothetical protein
MRKKIYLAIKDSEGVIRPKAGLFEDDKWGRIEVEKLANEGDQIVKVEILEITNN